MISDCASPKVKINDLVVALTHAKKEKLKKKTDSLDSNV